MYIGTEANIPDPDSDDDFIIIFLRGFRLLICLIPKMQFPRVNEWDGDCINPIILWKQMGNLYVYWI